MRPPKQTRFDLSDRVHFKTLIALLGKEGAAEVAAEGLRRLCSLKAGSMPVALQLRRSRSALEQEGSLRSQVLGAIDVLTRLGGRRVVMVYVYADTTGGKLWRRGLLDQVVTDADDGVMRELWHLDSKRLGRMPPRQVFAYLDALDKSAVRARNLSNPDADDDFAGDIKRMVDAEQNHRELIDKAQMSVERTLHRHLERGIHSGPAPYGTAYEVHRLDVANAPVRVIPRAEHFRRARYENARLIPGDPDEVRTVRAMVGMALDERLGYRGICQRLNAQGVPSPTGIVWNAATINKLLRNAVYVGDAAHFATADGEYMSLGPNGRPVVAGTGRSRRPRDQVPTKRDVHGAIVPRDRWEALQKELDSREKGVSNQHTLRGDRVVPPATCSHCGKAMKWRSVEDRLECSGYGNAGLAVCRSHRCVASSLAQMLWRAHARDVSELLGTPDLAGKVRARVRALLSAEKRKVEQPVDVSALRKRIAEIEREADRLVNGLSKESLELLDGRLRRLAGERKELERQAAAADKAKPRVTDLDDEVEAAVERLELLAHDPTTVTDDVLRALLAAVVRPGSLRLRWRQRPGTEGRKRGAFELDQVEVELLDPKAALAASTVVAEQDPPQRETARRGSGGSSARGPRASRSAS